LARTPDLATGKGDQIVSMWVQGLATEKVGERNHDAVEQVEPRRSLSDFDQHELADALMACALAVASPDEVPMLKAGYALALQRERTTSTR
jgi:hypothetical protein